MRRLLLVIAVVLMSLPGTLQAQAPEGATGTWFAVGAGGGWTRVSCSICAAERHAGPAGALRLGAAVRPGVLVSAEANVWLREHDEAGHMLATISGVGTLYPRRDGGLYLKGGAGYVTYRADDDIASNLFGLTVGAGYELRIGQALLLTNDVSLVASSFGALKDGGRTVADDVSVTMVQLGIGVRRR